MNRTKIAQTTGGSCSRPRRQCDDIGTFLPMLNDESFDAHKWVDFYATFATYNAHDCGTSDGAGQRRRRRWRRLFWPPARLWFLRLYPWESGVGLFWCDKLWVYECVGLFRLLLCFIFRAVKDVGKQDFRKVLSGYGIVYGRKKRALFGREYHKVWFCSLFSIVRWRTLLWCGRTSWNRKYSLVT